MRIAVRLLGGSLIEYTSPNPGIQIKFVNTSNQSEQFNQLMQTHYNALYDYGMKLTRFDEALTKDCIQEVFMTFWNSRDNWHTFQSIRAYLLVSMRNQVIDVYRINQRNDPFTRFPVADEPAVTPDLSFGDPSESSESARALNALFNQLPPRQREAIYLRYFGEMEYAEIARTMEVKERTVYNLVHEGLQQLRQTVARMPAHHRERLRSVLLFLKIFVG